MFIGSHPWNIFRRIKYAPPTVITNNDSKITVPSMKLAKPNKNLIISINIATQIRTIIMPTTINSILFITFVPI